MSKIMDLQAEVRLTSSEEAFCQSYAGHSDPALAWSEAFGDKGSSLANELAGKSLLESKRLRTRIKQLTVLPPDPENMSRAAYHQRITSIYEAAMADGDYTAANRSMELLGKSLGHLVEQKQTLNLHANVGGDDSAKKEAIKKLIKLTGVNLGQET